MGELKNHLVAIDRNMDVWPTRAKTEPEARKWLDDKRAAGAVELEGVVAFARFKFALKSEKKVTNVISRADKEGLANIGVISEETGSDYEAGPSND